MKRMMLMALSLALALSLTAVWSAKREQRAMAEKLVRLHVLANSDAKPDQELKLAVRDAVLAASEELLAPCTTRAQAEQALRRALPRLEQAAQAVAGEAGYAVRARLTEETYPRRTYDTFSLPAGEYLSLQIVIGEGAGRNWWCVVFPALCLAATAEEVEGSALAAGFTPGEAALLFAETEGRAVRLKVLEWLGIAHG